MCSAVAVPYNTVVSQADTLVLVFCNITDFVVVCSIHYSYRSDEIIVIVDWSISL